MNDSNLELRGSKLEFKSELKTPCTLDWVGSVVNNQP